jgi:hypothetical protein
MSRKMKVLHRRFIAVLGAVAAFVVTAAAQTVVVGTGDPNVDVPAVQAAVDQGGQVILTGHFSFDRAPTNPTVLGGLMATILVSKEVSISGTRDEQGEMTSIEGGTTPFEIEALGAHVVIQGLHFVRPKLDAINVFAVSGLVIASCRIEGVEPLPNAPRAGIAVNTSFNPPTAAQPGQPENISGTLLIFNNDIDVGGTAGDNTLGIIIFAAGKSPDREVDLYISGNNIKNTTERPIEINQVGGRVDIDRNVITTGTTSGTAGGVAPDVIHAVGSGSYLIAHNTIDSAWAKGAGIRVQGNPGLTEAGAIVVDNDVTMSAPEGTVFGDNSAGIEIRGFAQGNVVLNNRIRGRARAALAVAGQGAGVPGNNTFVSNDVTGFQSALADVFVDAGVTNTLVVGTQNTVADHGLGTLIVPTPF